MQKLFICLTIAFFTYCLPDELNHQSVQTPPIFKDVFSNQQQLPLSLYSCDTYKHRNTVVYSPTNSEHYTAAQWQQYFHNNNYCEKQILEQELLYLSDEFVKLAKTYAGYNQAIENLHKKFEKFGVCKKILHAFAGSYASGLKLRIKQLYQEIQFKKEYQERQINRQLAEYQELKAIYKEYSPLLAKAIKRRIDAQPDGSNQLQQIIELESIQIITHAESLSPYSILYPHQGALIDCATAVSDYNKEGFLDKAMCIADFCWSLLDYGQAIAEGVALGVYSAAHDILTNPIEATISIVAGKQVLAFQLCKVLYNVADIGVTAITNFDAAKEKWNKYAAPLNNLIDAINKKEITVRDAIKGGTAFVVGFKAQGKLLGGLSNFCKIIKHKSINFAKNNPLLNPQEYLTTSEGLLFKATSKSNKIKLEGRGCDSSNLKNIVEEKICKQKILSAVPVTGQGIIRQGDLRAKIRKYREHIFSDKHEQKGLMAVGEDQELIMDLLDEVLLSLDKKSILREGNNQLRIMINGIDNIEVRCFIQKGEVISINAFISNFRRIFSNFVDARNV